MSIAWLSLSTRTATTEARTTGTSTKSRSSITAPIHSCSADGSRAASRIATSSMPKLAKYADQRQHDQDRRPLSVAVLAERAHHERRDDHAEREVADAHDDLHEDVAGGALPRGMAS